MPPAHRFHYLLPSIAVAVLVAAAWLVRRKERLRLLAKLGVRWAQLLVPPLLAIVTFLAGTILLFSGATPAVHGRLRFLDDIVPLPLVELSHFFGSLAGVGLLILARGIQRRLDAAYALTVVLLGAGVLFSLLKGFDYEEALVLAAILVAFVPSRRYFWRRASLFEERFTPAWIAAIGLVVAGSIVLGMFSYRHRPDIAQDFWRFAFNAQAPRSLRAMVGVVIALMAFAAARLIRPARSRPPLPTDDELARARAIVERSTDASAQLALLGDKALLLDEAGEAVVAYGVQGRSWVAMGDPVGPPERTAELAETFVRTAVRHGGWPVFYKIGREQLHVYLELGLGVAKLGEEARVRLTDFSLDGPQRRNLRRVWRKTVDEGCSFAIVAPEEVPPILDELRAVSDDWLHAKKTREKKFSLGWFSDEYVRRHPVGVVRREGRIVAFANVWRSGCHEELEVDLMRFSSDAPPGVMRYLLVELMLWGRAEGYRWFNLAMAPLSGLRRSPLAPMWTQVGTAVYGLGERWYNFRGIRSFKEWFYPVWEPRYLASPPFAPRPMVLANIATLVSGGLEGVVGK